MPTTDDVVQLFEGMRAVYGPQWKHGGPVIERWRVALARFPVEQIRRAANRSVEVYVDHPPNLAQFLQLLKDSRRPSTYLPPASPSRAKIRGSASA